MTSKDEAIERLSELTERQREVLKLVCDGLIYKLIGEELFIEEGTVKAHMAHIYSKLGLKQLDDDERTKQLSQIFCPLLRGEKLPPAPPEPDEEEPVSDADIERVERDERALVVYGPKSLVPVVTDVEQEQDERRPFGFLIGIVVGALLASGVLFLLGLVSPGREPGTAQITTTPIKETVEVAVAQTVEVTREAIHVITVTPAPPEQTATPIIHTQVVEVIITATPAPTLTPTSIPESGDETTEQPPEETTPPEVAPPFSLPFVDNFDGGLRPEWEVRSGEIFIGNGRLGAASGEVTLSIGDMLTDYEVSFDYWNLRANYIELLVAPELDYLRDTQWSRWYEREGNEWTETVFDGNDAPRDGNLAIIREGNKISIFLNSNLNYEYIYNGELSAGPIGLAFEDEVQIDNFSLTVK